MKQTRMDIKDIASISNLSRAAVQAARGKRQQDNVSMFFSNFEPNINRLAKNIYSSDIPFLPYQAFVIHDPKKRIIHAPAFEDRVIHHAVMNFAGPVLDRAMVDNTFACRKGKGVHAAVRAVQGYARRFDWYVKIDIKSYFDSIDHLLLKEALGRRFRGDTFFNLIHAIILRYETKPGKGLPIGALPSQHFANYYLDRMDRYIMETLKPKGYVRYMDDVIFWCKSKEQSQSMLKKADEWVTRSLLLEVKMDKVQVNKSSHGVTFCGFRVFPGKIGLSLRKKRRYALLRKKWEAMLMDGRIDELKLMRAYDAVFSITAGADGREWRKGQLKRSPSLVQ